MSTTPTGGVDLSQGVIFQEQPDLTFWADPETNRIQGMADGLKAVDQAVDIMLDVKRFRWQIYGPYFGSNWDDLLGHDPGYVASELQRRIRDALSIDRRVLGIDNFSYSVSGQTMTAALTVRTVYGNLAKTVEIQQ